MACGKEAKTAGHEQADQENIGINDSTATKMKIKIGSGVFSATLSDNATARAFSSLCAAENKNDRVEW